MTAGFNALQEVIQSLQHAREALHLGVVLTLTKEARKIETLIVTRHLHMSFFVKKELHEICLGQF